MLRNLWETSVAVSRPTARCRTRPSVRTPVPAPISSASVVGEPEVVEQARPLRAGLVDQDVTDPVDLVVVDRLQRGTDGVVVVQHGDAGVDGEARSAALATEVRSADVEPRSAAGAPQRLCPTVSDHRPPNRRTRYLPWSGHGPRSDITLHARPHRWCGLNACRTVDRRKCPSTPPLAALLGGGPGRR